MSQQSTENKLTFVIMAAGKGTRMKSALPKVLHPVAGRPMLERVITQAKAAQATEIRVIIGHGGSLVRQVIQPLGVQFFEQKEQLGTAHAIRSANPDTMDGLVIIMNGDHPLIDAVDIKEIIEEFKEQKLDLGVVSVVVKNPGDLGRIVRHRGDLKAIVEAKDASVETLRIKEINAGIYIMKADMLSEYLPKISNNNSKGEYYLTDLISLGIEGGDKIAAIRARRRVAHGVNTQEELAKASAYVFYKKAKALMEAGVLIIDPKSTYIEESVQIAEGTVIYPNCYIKGNTVIGNFSVIEPNSFIIDCLIGSSVQIKAGSYLEKSEIHKSCVVGPYARLRPQTVLMEEAHIGNFVELKKTTFGKKSKAGHLSYLGDAEVGEGVNIGCGTITCNYAVDKQKYKTKIGNNVFVGSDTQFVAPIEIGDNAVIGSGSTITKDVPANALAVARGKQMIKENWTPKGK